MTQHKHRHARKTYAAFISLILALFLLVLTAQSSMASETETSGTAIAERSITISDPELGSLTFDAIAAGDPAAATTGKLVLLLHGFPESRESFSALLPVLAAKGYYAVAPNLRGYSRGVRPTDRMQYTVEKSAVDVVAMAFTLGAEKFHVVGHDWGGAVAWGISTALPGVLNSVSVLSTPHPDALRKAHEVSLQQRLMLSYLHLVKLPGLENAMFSGGQTGFAIGLNLFGVPYSQARIYARTIGNAAGLRAALSWYHANPVPLKQWIGKTTVPTLFMWGGKDFAFSEEAATRTADYVDAPYKFVPLWDTGHWVPERATDRVIAEVSAQIEANN